MTRSSHLDEDASRGGASRVRWKWRPAPSRMAGPGDSRRSNVCAAGAGGSAGRTKEPDEYRDPSEDQGEDEDLERCQGEVPHDEEDDGGHRRRKKHPGGDEIA